MVGEAGGGGEEDVEGERGWGGGVGGGVRGWAVGGGGEEGVGDKYDGVEERVLTSYG